MTNAKVRAEAIAKETCSYLNPESQYIEAGLTKKIAEALEAFAAEAVKEDHEERAAKQALIQGESVMLGGKPVTNEELYKQPTDYIREARNEALEEAARISDDYNSLQHYHPEIGNEIRALKTDSGKGGEPHV